MNEFRHIPVLLVEALEALKIQKNAWYIDGTLGGGGHAFEMIRRGARVLGIDQDEDATRAVQIKAEALGYKTGKELITVNNNFRNIKDIAEEFKLLGKVRGILLDLGVSSYQIDSSGRGFSIKRDEPLDMRMNKLGELTAGEIVNHWSETEIAEVLSRFGEEELADKIAQAIITRRQIKPFETSQELAKFIAEVNKRRGEIHPATKTFMALRIVVNNELGAIEEGVRGSVDILEKGGRMVVISFHSLEDRLIKRLFLEFESKGLGQNVNKRPIEAQLAEVSQNRRSRSAKMRIFEKN